MGQMKSESQAVQESVNKAVETRLHELTEQNERLKGQLEYSRRNFKSVVAEHELYRDAYEGLKAKSRMNENMCSEPGF